MKSTIDKVAEFHEMTNCPILDKPTIPSLERINLRFNLIREELNELYTAAIDGNLVEVADALTDLQYVLDGAYLEFGIKDIKEALFDEVQRSNMSKGMVSMAQAHIEQQDYLAKGIPCKIGESDLAFTIVRSDGKILKPSTYSPADLASIVAGKELAGA